MSWVDSIFKPQSSNKIELETGKTKQRKKRKENQKNINEKKRKEGQEQG